MNQTKGNYILSGAENHSISNNPDRIWLLTFIFVGVLFLPEFAITQKKNKTIQQSQLENNKNTSVILQLTN